MNRRFVLTVAALIFCCFLAAGMTFEMDVSYPVLRNNGFDNDLPVIMEPGEPMVSFHDLRILLPEGHRFVSADVVFEQSQTIDDVYIDYAQAPQPISIPITERTKADSEIYEADRLYPHNRYEVLGVQRKNGHDILLINVYPYRYNPVKNRLNWYSRYSITINTVYDQQTADEQNLFLVQSEDVLSGIASLVINPAQIHTYQKRTMRTDSILPDVNDPKQMIIISHQSKEGLFAPYMDWKENKGISCGFFAVNDIYQSYDGTDNQERIRNFIIDAYQTYSLTDTPLEYVILGGDDRIIPIRGMYGQVGQYVDYNMPADIYYSNLDGDWDANGNGIYGEPDDNPDWFAEVALGRIPAFTDSQFLNFFEKNYHYVDNDTFSNDIVYMLGENLDSHPTWGGDYKDEIIPYVPNDYHIDTLYERDGTFSISSVMNAFNNGLGIINHIGHANYFIVFGLNNIRIASLNNTDFGFAYTQGCYPAAFDTATSQESGCVGQNLVTASGGLFAFIGNTRYGWYSPGSTGGASQAYDLTFFYGLYEQDIRELGHTLNFSKEVHANQAMTSGVMRWIYYQLILFGDPSISVKDANGSFPYVQPVDVIFDDVLGDNDGMVNPGETIHIYLELENLPEWADAEEVTATVSFNSDQIYLVNDTVSYGFLPQNDSQINTTAPFIVEIDDNIEYGSYTMFVNVSAESVDGTVFNNDYQLQMPVTLLQKHWPWHSSYPIMASPLFVDFTGDDIKELIVVDALGNINLLDSEANSIEKQISHNENLRRSFAMGDINNDGNKEIVISSRYEKIMAIDNSGSLIFSYEDCGQQILTPLLSDLNNDGNLQIVSLGFDRNIYVLDHTGEISEGFPVQLPQSSFADLAAADINNDGKNEIVIGSLDSSIYVIRYDGTHLSGFPQTLDSGIITAPTILDNKRIAVGTTNRKLYLISPEGDIVFDMTLSHRINSEIIAADFTNNGDLELAFVTNNGSIHLIEQNGGYVDGWPIHLHSQFSHPPLAVDINGDDFVNLIAYSTSGRVFAFNHDGTAVDSFPFPLNLQITSPAAVADIDGDGDWDIIMATSEGISVVDYKQPKGDKTPWTMYRGNYHRTGFFGDNTTTDTETIPFSDYTTSLHQNYPNPFNPSTKIGFSLENDSPVKIEIFNIRGQRVATLVDSEMEAGNHSVIWSGMNNSNRPVGSGIYFYRLVTSDKTLTRKMLLVK